MTQQQIVLKYRHQIMENVDAQRHSCHDIREFECRKCPFNEYYANKTVSVLFRACQIKVIETLDDIHKNHQELLL